VIEFNGLSNTEGVPEEPIPPPPPTVVVIGELGIAC